MSKEIYKYLLWEGSENPNEFQEVVGIFDKYETPEKLIERNTDPSKHYFITKVRHYTDAFQTKKYYFKQVGIENIIDEQPIIEVESLTDYYSKVHSKGCFYDENIKYLKEKVESYIESSDRKDFIYTKEDTDD